MLYRAAIWTVWRNYMKDASENRKVGTPAQALGLYPRALKLKEILAERLFSEQAKLSAWLSDCYFGRIQTRAIQGCVAHTRRYAV
jgi:hypothetical protein